MSAVLGIDAAWTEKQPSGVALAVREKAGWQLRSVASSYNDFLDDISSERPFGCIPEPKRLLQAALRRAGTPISLVAIDMPLSIRPIEARRKADNEVSHCFGAKGAATHSPSDRRPGSLSDSLRRSFEHEGFRLATSEPLSFPCMIEVYPHPALITLCQADKRLLYKLRKYKVAKRGKLIEEWRRIRDLLDQEVRGCASSLALPAIGDPTHKFKAFEDMLDAVVCCWVGICALEKRAVPLGDASAAIWVPDCEDVKQFRKRSLTDLMRNAMGIIDSGVPDLATNQKYLESLGEDSMGR